MEKNVRESIREFLTEILSKSDVENFEFADFDDGDINFIVTPRLSGSKRVNIKLQFILYSSGKDSLTLYCPTLYKIKDNDSAMYTLNAINNVNSEMAVGKIYLNQNNSSVIAYINRILFTDITNELTPQILKEYIQAFLLCSLKFYHQMRTDLDEE